MNIELATGEQALVCLLQIESSKGGQVLNGKR
jgi:hypothetical protein